MLVLERGFGPFILTTSRVNDLKTKPVETVMCILDFKLSTISKS